MFQQKSLATAAELAKMDSYKPIRLSENGLRTILSVIDLVLILSFVTISPIVYLYFFVGPSPDLSSFLKVGIEASLVAVFFLIVRRSYEFQALISLRGQFWAYLQAWTIGFLVVMIEAFLTQTSADYSRGGMLFAFLPGFALACGTRFSIFRALRHRLQRHEIVVSSAFLVLLGERRDADTMVSRLRSRGIMVCGLCSIPAASLAGSDAMREAVIAKAVQNARLAVATAGCDAIYVMAPWRMEGALVRLQELLRRVPVPVTLLPDTFAFDAIVSNEDAVRTHRELLSGTAAARTFAHKRSYEPACSGVVLYLGLNKRYDHLAHHDFVFSRDPHEEFHHIYKLGEPAPDPTCYLACTAATDPASAPPGGEAMYVLVHTPYLRPHHDWSKMFPAYRQVIIDKLKRTAGLHDIEERIVFESALTPQDINDRYRVLNGAIYGISSHGLFQGAFKPANRSKEINGLYLAGGAAHPGPGMPMVMMSGWIAANSLDADFAPAKA